MHLLAPRRIGSAEVCAPGDQVSAAAARSLLRAEPQGLIASGETEASLASVIDVLKSVYAEHLCVGELTIRYRHGAEVEEPHMGVRVSLRNV
jgi:hypothetical protein